jgi:hypothetical protein
VTTNEGPVSPFSWGVDNFFKYLETDSSLSKTLERRTWVNTYTFWTCMPTYICGAPAPHTGWAADKLRRWCCYKVLILQQLHQCKWVWFCLHPCSIKSFLPSTSFLPYDVSHVISSTWPSSHLTFHVGGVREEGLWARLQMLCTLSQVFPTFYLPLPPLSPSGVKMAKSNLKWCHGITSWIPNETTCLHKYHLISNS